jgi:hypothetical protein
MNDLEYRFGRALQDTTLAKAVKIARMKRLKVKTIL